MILKSYFSKQVLQASTSLLLILLLAVPAFAESFTGRVIHVADGDTITVRHDGVNTRVRFAQIDCPEIRHGKRPAQPFGMAAKRFTLAAVGGKTVTIQVSGHDRYRRTIGEVIMQDGKDLNRELVSTGLAWWYHRYSRDRSLGELQAKARSKHLGLWAEPNPEPPWVYRHRRF